MKKMTFICLIIFAIPLTYFITDYVSFSLKSRNLIKKILIVSERLEPQSRRAKVCQAIEKAAKDNKNMVLSGADVTDLGFSFIEAQDAPAQKPITDQNIQKWASLVAQADGIIFLVPNYNNGYPGSIKNAIDVLWKEWHNKPVAVVAYSSLPTHKIDMIDSFKQVLHKINSDIIPTTVYLSFQDIKNLEDDWPDVLIELSLQKLITELYAETTERRYFRALYRSVIDRLFVTLLKLTRPKK